MSTQWAEIEFLAHLWDEYEEFKAKVFAEIETKLGGKASAYFIGPAERPGCLALRAIRNSNGTEYTGPIPEELFLRGWERIEPDSP